MNENANSNPESPETSLETIERIRALAHQLWEDEGRPEGRAEQHWLTAEAIIKAQLEAARTEKPEWLRPGPTPAAADAEPTEAAVKDLGDIRQRLQGRSVA